MNFVSLELAKDHLYVDQDADDILINQYIKSASRSVKNYLKSASPFEVELDEHLNEVTDSNGDPVYVTDSNGDKVVRFEVESATLLMVGYLYRMRDNNEGGEFEQGYLPKPVTALLYPLRKPSLA